MWDNGNRYPYPYGSGFHDDFAVTVVDEPRILPDDQLIDVGCLVKRGTKSCLSLLKTQDQLSNRRTYTEKTQIL